MALNFKMSELIHSDTAKRLNINNMPDVNSLDNLLQLIYFCLQPIRTKLNKPMIITSGYRCNVLNQKVGGSPTSAHKYGKACDFVVNGMTVAQIVTFIRNCGVPFTQLIEEHGKSGCWVHISYDPTNLKKEVLRYKNGIYNKI